MGKENPYIAGLVSSERAFGRTDRPNFGLYNDIEAMTKEPVLSCPNGHKAWYKATVGTYKCPTCGLIRIRRVVDNVVQPTEWR